MSPAIISPEGFGLNSGYQVNEKMRRTLVMIGKVLQNLANKREFGNKEPFMLPLNPFMRANEPVLNQFYEALMVNQRKYNFNVNFFFFFF